MSAHSAAASLHGDPFLPAVNLKTTPAGPGAGPGR
jgi:hypothetical protein